MTVVQPMTVVHPADYFEELRHLENSKLPNHRLTLSVLKAAEQGIAKRGLERSADHYYMAIWPLLFHPPATSPGAEQDWTGCILGLVARFVSFVNITPERYSEMYAGLSQCDRTWSLAAVKAAIVCAAHLLLGFQETESSRDLFRQLLLFNCIDARPKVRKQAHESMLALLPGLNNDLKDELLQLISTVLQESSRRDCQNALHMLRLLKQAIPMINMGESRESELLGSMRHCLSLGNAHLSCSCLDVLELLCLRHEHGSQYSEAIYALVKRHRPEEQMDESLVPWLLAFSQAACQYGARDAIVHALDVVFEVIQSDREDILVAGRTAVECLLKSRGIEAFGRDDHEGIAGSLNPRINVKKFESFHPATLDICHLVFTAFSEHLLPSFASTIQLLAMLHSRRGFMMQSTVERVLQDVCRFIGVQELLTLVPLKLVDGSYKNGWLVGVLARGCFNDSLLTFKQRLLPLHEQLLLKSTQLAEAGNSAQAKALETLANQTVSCFGSFLRFPTDFDTEFDDRFAQTCAGWLNGSTCLRPIVCNAISNMIDALMNFGLDADGEDKRFPRGFTADMADKYLVVLAGLAPKLLPVLFNLCIVSPSEHTCFLLKCIQSLLSCSDPRLSHEYFERLLARLPQLQDSEQAAALLDIAGALVATGTIPEHSLSALLDIAQQGLGSPEGHYQKRSYQILLILGQREEHAGLLAGNQQLLHCLVSAAVTCDASARKLRFKVLMSLDLGKVDSEVLRQSLVPSVLPEVVLGTKEVNHKARQSAFDLIVRWGRHFQVNGALDDYVHMAMAGLAAKTPTMMAGTLLALARLVFEFREQVACVGQLLDDAIIILSSPTKEVVKAAIGFVKVAILVLDRTVIGEKLPAVLSGLLVWAQEHTQHFKARVRHIVERLIRQHGYDRVRQCCPEEHLRLLANIQQTKQRRAKRKQSAKAADKHDDPVQHQVRKPFDEAMFGDESDEELLAEDDMELVASGSDGDRDGSDGITGIQTSMSKRLSFKSMRSIKSLKSTRSKSGSAREKGQRHPPVQPDPNLGFKTNKKTGKLIFDESDGEDVEVDAVAASKDVPDADFYAAKKKQKKRKQLDSDSDQDTPDDKHSVQTKKSAAMSRASGKSNAFSSKSSAFSGKSNAFSGKSNTLSRSQVRRKKGDTLRAGSLEPYAYVPLARKRTDKKSKYFME